MEKKTEYITLRIQPSLKKKVRSLAEQSHRSISAQVVYLLEKGIEAEEREQLQRHAFINSSEVIMEERR